MLLGKTRCLCYIGQNRVFLHPFFLIACLRLSTLLSLARPAPLIMNIPKQKSRILIVDDDKSNVEVLARILKTDYEVFVARSGEEALEKINCMETDFFPDLILLDIIMPSMSGFELLAKLKGHEATKGIPVICITGLDSVEDENKGLFLGAVDYITRPFHDSIVRARVKTHLQTIRYVRHIEQLGLVDVLTNLPNRRSFDKQLYMEWKRSKRDAKSLGMIKIEIDRFNEFEELNGHYMGEQLLQEVARVIQSVIKRPSDLAARLGGSMFSVLLPNTDLEGVKSLAKQMQEQIEQIQLDGPDGADSNPKITVFFACVSELPDDYGTPVTEFVARCDRLLAQSKQRGSTSICS